MHIKTYMFLYKFLSYVYLSIVISNCVLCISIDSLTALASNVTTL